MDDSAIRAITPRFVEAYSRKDAAAAVRDYADNAKVLPPNMPMVSGKAAIRDFWKFAMDMGVHLNLEAVDLVVDGGACAGQGATTVDITEPYWRVIKAGAIEEKELADCLQPS